MEQILLATSNGKKIEEVRGILAPSGVRVLGLGDLDGVFDEPDENADTFEGNALLKARGYAEQTACICLAEDSGLEVDALNGRPGIYSARFSADRHADWASINRTERDARNSALLLEEMEGRQNRACRYVCTMCLFDPARSEALFTSHGTFECEVGSPPRVPAGRGGFGYDPIIMAGPDFTRTVAELDDAEKHARSHRGVATRALLEWLRSGP